MSKVRVEVFATLRDLMGWASLEVESGATTVSELLKKVRGLKGSLHEIVIDSQTSSLRKYYKIMVNGRDIEFLDGLATEIKDGDNIIVIPPVAGGAGALDSIRLKQ